MSGDIAAIFPGGFNADDYRQDSTSIEEQIRDAMISNGYKPPSVIIIDGEVHRFPLKKSSYDDTGWYRFYPDPEMVCGYVGDWREGGSGFNFRQNIGRPLSLKEEINLKKRQAEAAKIRDEEREKAYKEAAEEAQSIFNSAGPADSTTGYCKKKGLKGAYKTKVAPDGRLLVPGYNEDGEISTIQFIPAEGKKLFLSGSKASGAFFPIGEKKSKIYFSEGFATAATIYEETGEMSIVCFGANNIPKVVSTFKKIHSDVPLIVIADRDEHKAGERFAAVAVEESGARMIVCPEMETGTDVNDYREQGGDLRGLLEVIKNKFEPHIIQSSSLKDAFLKTLSHGWLIKEILPESAGLTVIYGDPGTYKSFMTLDMVLSMACGMEWHGKATKEQRVLYVAGEGQEGLLKRIEAWRQYKGIDEIINFDLLPISCFLDDNGDVIEFNELLKILPSRPDLVVFDTLARSMSGEENSKVDMGNVVRAVDEMRTNLGCKAIIVHHSGKDKSQGMRGTNSLEAATHVVYKMEKKEKEDIHKVTFITERQKDDEAHSPIDFEMKIIDTGFKNSDGDPVTSLVPIIDMTEKREKNRAKAEDISNLTGAFSGMKTIETAHEKPYITRSKWADYLEKTGISKSKNAANQAVKSKGKGIAERLITAKIIAEFRDGYYVLNDEVSTQIFMSVEK